MIPADYQTCLFIYIAAWLLTLAVLWGRELWRQKAHDWEITKKPPLVLRKMPLRLPRQRTGEHHPMPALQ